MVGRANKVGSKCFVGDFKVGEKITNKKKPKKRSQHNNQALDEIPPHLMDIIPN